MPNPPTDLHRPKRWRSTPRALLLSLIVGVGILANVSGCFRATEIVLAIDTDVPCTTVQARQVAIVVAGSTPVLSTTSPVATTAACTPGAATGIADLGTLVLVPSGERDARVTVMVALGVDRPTEECLAGDARGCIIARRATGFLSHRSRRLPVRLDQACLGVSCEPNSTCDRGRCVALELCDVDGCSDDGTPRVDAGGADTGDGGASLVCPDKRADCDRDPNNGCEVDLTTAAHCGACGHDCGASSCNAGICTPSTLMSGLDTPRGLLVAEGDVYVGLDLDAPAGRVLHCPTSGCSGPTVVASGLAHPNAFAATGTALYFADELSVFRCARPGCAAPTIACAEGARSIVVNNGDIILASAFNIFVGRCTPQSTSPSYFANPFAEVVALARDGTSVFFAEMPQVFGNGGGIDVCPLPAGCGISSRPPLLNVAPPNTPLALDVDATQVFWSESASGNVMRANKTLDAPAIVVASGKRPRGIVLEGPFVYWADEGMGVNDGSIHRANKDGSGHVVLAMNEPRPTEIALGPSSDQVKRIFWTNRVPLSGAVRFVAR